MKSPLISLASRFDLAARALSALLLSALAIGGAFGAEPFVQDSGAAGLISIEVENHDASYPYSQLVIFGDSMSDTGNLFGLTGGALPSDPPYAQGHYSNGQVWPEYAASAMGVPLRNYAYGSALTGYQNLDGPYPGMRTGLDDYVASNSGGVDPNGLYVVWAGANDFFNLSSFSSGAISATIDQAVSNIITAVSQLAALDAQHIVVGTLPDLGLIPYATGGESLGSPAQLSSASAQFNTQLRNALASTGLSPLVLDSYEILNRVVSSGSTYGLTNVSDRCVQASGAVCSSPSDYLFWDDRHPSTEGHRVLAEQFLGLVGGSAAPPHAWTGAFPSGASGGKAMEASPNTNGNIDSGYVASSPQLRYQVDFVNAGVHYVWIRGKGPTSRDDSLHVGLNGAAVSTADRITDFTAAWTWSKDTMDGAVAQINIPSAGVHTINVWMREDGILLDKLVLTRSTSYAPTGAGPAESPRGQAAPVAQTPLITPAGGSYTDSVTVTLSTGNGADTIHYTTNGSTPTAASPVYGGDFALTASATVKAIGLRSGYADSAVASASFTITPATEGGSGSGEYQQAADGLVSIELENHDNTTSASGHSWNTVSRTGASGTAVQSLPNNSTNINSGYASSSPRMDYAVNFTRSGVHYVWIRGQGPSNKDDSLHVGLNGAAVSTADRITNFSAAWTWSKGTMDGAVAQINIPSAGVHTINVWMREDGMIGDKLVLTPSAGYTPTGAGPAESIRGTAASGSLVFDKTVLEFAVVSGGGNPAVMGVTLRAADGSNVPVTLSTSDSWLSVTPASGSTPVGTASVSVDPSSLAAGVYSASVTASATGFNAATLDVVVTASPSLPFEQDFSGGGTADWTVVESSGDASNWRISGGAYQQLNTTSRTVHGPDIYVDGSFSYLNTGLGLADYRFSVDVTSTANDPEQIGSDLGILFRVQDKENYYRFALNSKFGYSELVKRKAEVGKPGVYSTLAVDSRGYRPGKTLRLGVEVVGPTMRVYVAEAGTVASVFDTDPLFAARDSDHTSGSIALYTQAKARFDNLRVDPPTSAARIGIAKAVSFGVETGAAVPVGAVVSNMPSGGRVEFSIDGAACGSVSQTAPGYFQSSCSAPSQGEHELVARLLNSSGGELDRDTNLPVGSEGEALLVIGDSISNGVGDRYGTDNISRDIALNGAQVGPRMISIRGYDTPLHDLLTASTLWTAPNGIANAGVPGDRSDQALDRIGSVLARHPGANRALFLLGTNDVLSSISPSPGAFKDILQDLIDQSEAAGVAPMFAKIPPIFGVFKGTVYTNPASRSHNVLVRQYNAVIDELNDENLLKPGPDLYSALMPASGPLISLSRDNLHPNALGHSMMAQLWFNALTGANTQPFVLRDLCLRLNSASCEYPGSYTDPVYYQQTLLELGSPYSVDLGSTLTRIPTQLEGGIWVTTATAHRTNTRADYLSFTVDRAVEVYVAYDGAASTLPTWLRGFSATGETVGVSGAAGTLDVYRRSYVADSNVTLGGASADGKSGTISENYLVVVQEQ